MNKYGYFKYSDFALGAKENATYSTSNELQEGSSLADLSVGVAPYDYASLEQDVYVTTEPKLLYKSDAKIGMVTKEISDKNGEFPSFYPVTLTITFANYFSMTGLTINSRNKLERVDIIAVRDGQLIASESFYEAPKDDFFAINTELVNLIIINIFKIDKPYHFVGIHNIDFGRIRIFDDNTSVNAEITNNFSVLGDTLEYDTLDLTVIDPEREDYLFQRRQPIDYIVDEKLKSRFYIESGKELDNNTLQMLAYDDISNLEDTFYGGMYTSIAFGELLYYILDGTNINYEQSENTAFVVSGYLPISSRRKALQTLLQGTNVRCYKGEKLIFKPLETEINGVLLNETNIINKPQKEKKQQLKSLVVKKHNYSKGTEETELYHWYISTTENVRITFPAPMHSLKAYEVTGVDENGQDIISTSESENVTFVESGANYCIVSNRSSNKIVIVGLNYIDSTVDYKKVNPLINANEVFEEETIDLTISQVNPQVICNLLYDLYSRKNSIRFNTFVDVEVGGLYNILGENLHIKNKKQFLNGIYEVEAV